MPMVQKTAAIAAGGEVENVLAGSQFEFLPWNAFIEFAVNGSAAGLLVDIYSGQDVLAEGSAVNTVNAFPKYPDDFMLNDVAAGGERIKVKVRNPTAGALTYFSTTKFTPV